MTDSPSPIRSRLLKELALFLGFFLFGILLLPIAIYIVGQSVFGDYGGHGFLDFYSRLHYELRSGGTVSWYLVLSPYLVWSLLRATIWGFRRITARA